MDKCAIWQKKTFFDHFGCKIYKIFSKVFFNIFKVSFFMLNSNLLSDLNNYERFARYLNCTEPHSRFL